jgi:hypothetical protein
MMKIAIGTASALVLLMVAGARTHVDAQAPLAQADRSIVAVGANIPISTTHPADAHYEVLSAADPVSGSRALACSFVFAADDGRARTSVYASFDGGKIWEPTLTGPQLFDTSDPACTFGPNGEAYYAAASLVRGEPRTMKFFRSADGGKTWSSPTILQYMDRQYVFVDTTESPYRGRVYVNGNNRADSVSDIVLYRSVDGGATFLGPAKRPDFGKFTADDMGNGVVMSDGTIAMVLAEAKRNPPAAGADAPASTLKVVFSTDGGETLTPAVTVSDRYMSGGRKALTNAHIIALPSMAVDASAGPFRDRLYVVWADKRSGRSEIFFSSSADKGKTWTPARAVSDAPARAGSPGPDASMAAIAVNNKGVVGVSWYDRRDSADNLGWAVRFAVSLDGGGTFLPSVPVSSANATFPATPDQWDLVTSTTGGGVPFERTPRKTVTVTVQLRNFTTNGGDTAGLAADVDGVFHPVWVDNRTRVPQLWTAPVTVSRAAALPHTATADDSLTDVSDRLMIDFVGRPAFDPATGRVTLRARVKNTSKEIVHAPLKARVVSLRADLGEITVSEADNGLSGPGAIWDFTPQLRNGALGPNETSDARMLSFQVANLRPFQQGQEFRHQLVTFEAVFLAKLRPAGSR